MNHTSQYCSLLSVSIPLATPLHTDSRLGHITGQEQWNINLHDTNKGLRWPFGILPWFFYAVKKPGLKYHAEREAQPPSWASWASLLADLLTECLSMNKPSQKLSSWGSLVAQQVKDLALSLLWLRPLLWCKFDPWSRNSPMQAAQPKGNKNVKFKTKYRTTIWPSNPTPGHISRQNFPWKKTHVRYVHCNTIHSSRDMETT